MSAQTPALFAPICVGTLHLSHRLVLAPLSRFRANLAHEHGQLAAIYYSQRAFEPGTLLVTEGTLIGPNAGGQKHVPGIWSDKQIEAWKCVTDAVHAKGSYIYLQLWALGRAADPKVLQEEDPDFRYVSSSNIPLTGRSLAPRALTTDEIGKYVQQYAQAASNAVHRAGFDGVEIHGANGYLVDQFTQFVTNKRTDKYGGSVENRSRFALEVIEAVSKEVGQERTALRLSPWGWFHDMRGLDDPIPQFSYLVQQLVERFPKMAYLHLIEPLLHGPENRPAEGESNDFIRDIWKQAKRPLVSAGGYTRETALDVAEKKGDLIAFGRHWVSNPDLPRRLRENLSLTPYDRSTFYSVEDPHGYIDYPFVDEQTQLFSRM